MENIIEEIVGLQINSGALAFYKEFVDQFKAQKNEALNWNEDKRRDFLNPRAVASLGQSCLPDCINEKKEDKRKITKIVEGDNWKELSQYIDNISKEDNDEKLFEQCIKFHTKIGEFCRKDTPCAVPRLAIHAMINALRPEFFSRVVKEEILDEIYAYIKNKIGNKSGDSWPQVEKAWQKISELKTTKKDELKVINKLPDAKQKKERRQELDWQYDFWYRKSHAIAEFFNTILKKNKIEKENAYSHPWAFYEKKVFLKQMADNLKLQKNIIFTGAPGTGKTYLAKEIAKEITNNKDEKIGKVQFHPSYDYTDFVEGLRPVKNANSFERTDGIFKEFCEKALKNPQEEFVFIIDEINRGEISKIFGELFFSIDPGYRGVEGKVTTQYQNLVKENDVFKDGFYVPKNVYIIGTMNDIDRSVESMDFAFRRRFAFHEVTAEDSENIINSLNEDTSNKDEAKKCFEIKKKMRHLNEALVSDKCGLTRAYQIGGAYFLKLKDVDFKYDRLWNEYLSGVLYEYFRGEPDAEEKLAVLKEAFDRED